MVEHQIGESNHRFYTREIHKHHHIPGYELMSNPETSHIELQDYLGGNQFSSEFSRAISANPRAYSLIGITEDFIDIFCVKADDPAADATRTTAFDQFLLTINQIIDLKQQTSVPGEDYKLSEFETRSLAVFFMITTARLESLKPPLMEGKFSEISDMQWASHRFLNAYRAGKNKFLLADSPGGEQVIAEIENFNETINNLRDYAQGVRQTMAETLDILEAGRLNPPSSPNIDPINREDIQDTVESVDNYVKSLPLIQVETTNGQKTENEKEEIRILKEKIEGEKQLLTNSNIHFNPHDLEWCINNLVINTTQLHTAETEAKPAGWTPQQQLADIQAIRNIYELAMSKINKVKKPNKYNALKVRYLNQLQHLKKDEAELRKQIKSYK